MGGGGGQHGKKVTYIGGRFGSGVQLSGCGRLFLRWCWGRAGGRLSSCTVLAPDPAAHRRVDYFGHVKKGCKFFVWVKLYVRDRERERENLNDKSSETYRAKIYAPPQLDAVEIEVAIGPQRKVDLVIYDGLRALGVLPA